MNNENSVYSVDLPYWTGVSESPILNVPIIPFSVQRDENGSYKQVNYKTIEQIISKYSNEEYSHITTPPGESSWANSLTDCNIEYLRNYVNLEGKKVLDIAGVNSYIADILFKEDKILEYTIINPSLSESSSLSDKINYIKGYFPQDLPSGEKFDVVMLFNCLEHVPNPKDFLVNIKNILNPDGVLILKTSNDENLLKNGDLNVFLHEHLFYFTKNSFINMVKDAELKVLKANYDNDSTVALLGVDSAREKFDKLESPVIDFSIFDAQINYSKSLFENLLKNNSKIIFHGACLGLVNLAQLLKNDVDISDIQVVDIDEKKHNKFLPGFNKPILFPDEILAENFDYIIVGAATFIEPIKKYWINQGVVSDNIITFYDDSLAEKF